MNTKEDSRGKEKLKILPFFSWDIPIEEELLRWAGYMKHQNLNYIQNTIWGKKQKREAEIYARVFEMVEKRIKREIELRQS